MARFPVILSDGGRERAGFTLTQAGGDCFPRAICNAAGEHGSYRQVWEKCADINASAKVDMLFAGDDPSNRDLIGKRNLDGGTLVCSLTLRLMEALGFVGRPIPIWERIPLDILANRKGRYVVGLYGHATCLVGGCIFDTFDPQADPRIRNNGLYGLWEYKG